MGITSSILSCGVCYCSRWSWRVCCCRCPSVLQVKVVGSGAGAGTGAGTGADTLLAFSFMDYDDLDQRYRVYRGCRLRHSINVVWDRQGGRYNVVPFGKSLEYVVHDLERDVYVAFVTREVPLFRFSGFSGQISSTREGDAFLITLLEKHLGPNCGAGSGPDCGAGCPA